MHAATRHAPQLRALSLAQRQLLYAHDELAMAVSRLRLRLEGEAQLVDKVGREAAFDLAAVHPAELPIRNVVSWVPGSAIDITELTSYVAC